MPDKPTDLDSDTSNDVEQSTQPVQPDDGDTTPFDDEKTDEAIDDIVSKEGDEVLAAQDAAAAKGAVQQTGRESFLLGVWRNKWARWAAAVLVFAGSAALLAVPKTRYVMLNTASVRSSSSVTIVDSTTQLPLKGVQVQIGPLKVETNSEGEARLSGLRLGPQQLRITQIGFAEIKRNITIGWGSNPLGNVALRATGVQYTIEVRDYLSEKPLEGVEATSGEATALSDKDGKVTLTLASTALAKDGVALRKSGYRTENITLGADPKVPAKAALVLARKAVFVNKQSGKYDVYKSDIDGQNREVLLPGTGHETSNISLAVSPDGNRAAFVSTRENKRDASGSLLSTLTLIDVENGTTLTIGEASQMQLIDWIGPRLVYQQVSSSTSAANRYTVISYGYADNSRLQLAAANKLNAVLSAQGAIYYAVAANDNDASVQPGFFKIAPDGTGKLAVLQEEVWTALRTAYNTLSLQTADGSWQSYDIPGGSVAQLGTPGSLAAYSYIDNTDRSRSVWINQGTLMSRIVAGGKEATVTSSTGLAYPMQWLSSSAVLYRISSSSETADYAVSTEGGTPHKVADVTATYGFSSGQ